MSLDNESKWDWLPSKMEYKIVKYPNINEAHEGVWQKKKKKDYCSRRPKSSIEQKN